MIARRPPAVILLLLAILIAGLAASWIVGGWMMRGRSAAVAAAVPPARDFRIGTRDGVSIAATFRPGRGAAGPGVLLLHGVDASRNSVAATATFLSRLGYATLAIAFSGHGAYDVRPRSFGWNEAEDARAGFAWLKRRQAGGRIAVVGVSMGGAASLLGGEGPLPADALVMQAVYPDLRHAIRDRIAARLGMGIATVLEPLLSLQTMPRVGIWPGSIAPVRALARVSAPVLVIGGREDRSTPPRETMAMYAAVRDRRALWLVPHGDHAAVCALDTPEYHRRLADFLAVSIGAAASAGGVSNAGTPEPDRS